MTTNQPLVLAQRWARLEAEAAAAHDDALAALTTLHGRVQVRALARAAGTSPATVSTVLRGGRAISAALAVRLATHAAACARPDRRDG